MTQDTLLPPTWVATPAALQKLAAELVRQPRVAVDTESNGLHAYREQVCLVQFSAPGHDWLVDPLALAHLDALADLFADAGIEKIFHAAEYDLFCLQRDFGFQFAGIFDTMIAARALGKPQVGLGSLLKEFFELELNKRYQRADWGRRPLSPEMLLYAQQDTHYLFDLRDRLMAELQEAGRLGIVHDDFALVCMVEPPGQHNGQAWERLDPRNNLSPREQTVLHALLEARETAAARLDRPVFKVVGNDLLVTLAKETPHDRAGLLKAGMTTHQADRFGHDLLPAIRRGLGADLVERTPKRRTPNAFVRRLDHLRTWRKKLAAEWKVESDVILPRRLLFALAENGPTDFDAIMALSPWRLENFGEPLRKLATR